MANEILTNQVTSLSGSVNISPNSSSSLIVTVNGDMQCTQIATPPNPPAGSNGLYFKSDNKLYQVTSAGVESAVGGGGGVAWGAITGTLSSQTDLNTALGLKAPLASPTFTGTISVPAGSSSAPSYSFTSAAGVGLYKYDVNTLGLSFTDGPIRLGSDAPGSFGFTGFYAGTGSGTAGYGMISGASPGVTSDTSTMWVRGDIFPRGIGGSGYGTSVNGAYFTSSVHNSYAWGAMNSNVLFMNYSNGTTLPSFSGIPGTIKVATGTNLTLDADRVIITNSVTPASSAAAGVAGTVCWDASFIYVCTATNTWKRTAITTW